MFSDPPGTRIIPRTAQFQRVGRWGFTRVRRMSAHRRTVSSHTEFEEVVGYSRAVRIGQLVCVAGTTGAGDSVGVQTRDALHRIDVALREAGCSLTDVVRTRMFVTDISQWRDIAAVHQEVFGAIRPVSTMVEVRALISPELMVEIEADAYVCD